MLSSPGRGSSSRTVGLQASRCCCGDGGVAFPSAEALGFRRRACAHPLDVFVSLEVVAFFLFFAQSSSPGGGREMSESADCFETCSSSSICSHFWCFFLLYKKLRFLNSLVFFFFSRDSSCRVFGFEKNKMVFSSHFRHRCLAP